MQSREFTVREAMVIGRRIGIDFKVIDLEQFRLGLAIELEHGLCDPITNVANDDLLLTGKIAWAHLREIPDYYTRLNSIEAEAEGHN